MKWVQNNNKFGSSAPVLFKKPTPSQINLIKEAKNLFFIEKVKNTQSFVFVFNTFIFHVHGYNKSQKTSIVFIFLTKLRAIIGLIRASAMRYIFLKSINSQ